MDVNSRLLIELNHLEKIYCFHATSTHVIYIYITIIMLIIFSKLYSLLLFWFLERLGKKQINFVVRGFRIGWR